MFEVPSDETIAKVTITKEAVTDGEAPKIQLTEKEKKAG